MNSTRKKENVLFSWVQMWLKEGQTRSEPSLTCEGFDIQRPLVFSSSCVFFLQLHVHVVVLRCRACDFSSCFAVSQHALFFCAFILQRLQTGDMPFQCTLGVVLGFIDFYFKVGKYKRENPMVALHNGIYIYIYFWWLLYYSCCFLASLDILVKCETRTA